MNYFIIINMKLLLIEKFLFTTIILENIDLKIYKNQKNL